MATTSDPNASTGVPAQAASPTDPTARATGTTDDLRPGPDSAATWGEFVGADPDFSGVVGAAFRAHRHHVLATIRKDGAPRVSGTEVDFRGDEMLFGSMPGARKARDLQRDPRFALHAMPGDTSMQPGDVKISGLALEVRDKAELSRLLGPEEEVGEGVHVFRVLLTDAVLTTVEGDELVVRTWRPATGVREIRRQG
ncbi:pyridoxamine 5'-phosphate oxidase family protein [Streptomonospora nanhaiensis]|uniref:pyridoxamine 5'-phosphate oxidase family protein n=1 Tax=Streptomonospora nanhaiensis TaxID=1323731 RepID=UPI001C9A1AD7|nr:pyridoxamine 5'-phosphate oxidase family protein [Streptomonospora nanhaiensis]MBX9387056.1 pyridoxamine 5'-phosphate oxidase family protein [Streptomonospora nanhaiensis]